MSATATTYEHITLDQDGVPQVAGANTKVTEIVLQARAHGLTPEQLHLELPHLSLGQIHSALAYYWDHKDEMDADLRRRRERAREEREDLGQPPVAQRLRDLARP